MVALVSSLMSPSLKSRASDLFSKSRSYGRIRHIGTPGGQEELGSTAPSLSPCSLPSSRWLFQPFLSKGFQACKVVAIYREPSDTTSSGGPHPTMSSLYRLQLQCRGMLRNKKLGTGICLPPGADYKLARVSSWLGTASPGRSLLLC